MRVERRFPIPSVFTYHWKAQEILGLMRRFGKVFIGLEEGSHCRTTTPVVDEGDKNGAGNKGSSRGKKSG